MPFFVFVAQNFSVPAPSFFRVLLTQLIRHRRAIIYDNHICCAFGTLFAAISDKRVLVGVYLDLAPSCRTCTVVLLDCYTDQPSPLRSVRFFGCLVCVSIAMFVGKMSLSLCLSRSHLNPLPATNENEDARRDHDD